MKRKILFLLSSVAAFFIVFNIVILIVMASSGGAFKVNNIEITSCSTSKPYDGTPLTYEKCEITSGALYDGDTIQASYDGTITEVGTARNLFTCEIVNKSGKDVTSDYEINYVFGNLEITKREITVKLQDEEIEYDGTERFLDSFEITEGNLIGEDYVEVKPYSGLTEIGSSRTSFVAHVYNKEGKDVSDNYNITSVDGTITRTAVSLTIQSSSGDKLYDTEEFSETECKLTRTNAELVYDTALTEYPEFALIGNDKIHVTLDTKATDVGEYENKISYEIVNENGEDVSACYNVTTISGTITIHEPSLKFKSRDISKTYDGNALQVAAGDITLEEGNIESYMNPVITPCKSILNVGSAEAAFTVAINDPDGKDITSNYSIQYDYGTMTINRAIISLTTGSKTFVYDGNSHSLQEYINNTPDALIDGDTLQVVYNTAPSEAGEYENLITASVYNSVGKAVTYNYDITINPGKITISPVTLEIVTGSATKNYDGTPLTSDEYYLVSGKLAEGQHLEMTMSGSQTEVGTSDNVGLVKIYDESGQTIDVTKAYTIHVSYGLLKVVDASSPIIYVAPENIYKNVSTEAAQVYTHSGKITGFEDYEALGYTYEAKVSGSVDSVGTSKTSITSLIIYDKNGNDVTSKFEIKKYDGVMIYYLYEFTVTTSSKTKTYDGTALSDTSYEISGLDNVIIDAEMNATITSVGSVKNSVVVKSVKVNDVNVSTSECYIHYVIGKLTVERKEVTITSASKTASVSEGDLFETTITSDGLVEGHKALVTSYTKLTDPGITDNVVTVKIVDSENKDVTGNYKITYDYGTLMMTED